MWVLITHILRKNGDNIHIVPADGLCRAGAVEMALFGQFRA